MPLSLYWVSDKVMQELSSPGCVFRSVLPIILKSSFPLNSLIQGGKVGRAVELI